MNRVFHQYLDQFVIAFINNILIYFTIKEENAWHLRIVLQSIREHQLFTKFSKCEICLEEVKFLGHIISSDGVLVDPAKVEAVLEWQPLTMVTEVRSFLRLACYYNKIIKTSLK